MRVQRPTRRDVVVGRLADRKHGVVARHQLVAAGISLAAVGRGIEAGRLRPLFRGVYAVGHAALRREGWWTAALLTCGDGAALSHPSGGTLWDLTSGPTFPIHVIPDGDRGRKQARIVIHRIRLHPDEATIFNGLRVTTPARTIVDLASHMTPRSLRHAVERAQDLRRFHPTEIEVVLGRTPGRRGTRQLRDLLALLQPDADNARSHLERLFLALVRRARLPPPVVNQKRGRYRPDFAWPAQRLLVEVDGYQYHSTRSAQRRDRRRDREVTVLGWRPVRFTYEEVAFEPDQVAKELTALLAVD